MAAMPPRATNMSTRMSQQQMPVESIYNIKPEQPMVVQYTPDQMHVPAPAMKAPPRRKAPVPAAPRMARASSVGNNRAAQNAGSAIMSSGSQRHIVPQKESVPKADEVNKLKQREQHNFVKDNMNKAIFEMQPPAA